MENYGKTVNRPAAASLSSSSLELGAARLREILSQRVAPIVNPITRRLLNCPCPEPRVGGTLGAI